MTYFLFLLFLLCLPRCVSYRCHSNHSDCPIGYTGKNCDQQIKHLSDVKMIGRRSYLSVKWPNTDVSYSQSDINDLHNNEIEFNRLRATANDSDHNVAMDQQQSARIMHPTSVRLMQPYPNFTVAIPKRLNPTLLVQSPSITQHHRVAYFSIEFQIRPLSERGLLLYFGVLGDHNDRGLGFVSVSLQGGVVEFRVSGTSTKVAVVRSVRTLAIGEWHKIKVTQSGRRLMLWVEGNAASSTAASSEVLIDINDSIYVGGLSDLSQLPYNAISGFPVPYRGCIRKLIINSVSVALNESNVVGEFIGIHAHDRQ